MSLLRLPPETLQQILNYLGSSFFREDLSRLTICKQWFAFARPICYKCVTLSQEPLRLLISSGGAKKSHPLKDSLETLDLEIEGCRAHDSVSYIGPPQESNDLIAPAPDEAFGNDTDKNWIEILDDDLAQLAIVAQQSHRLHTFRIKAWSFPSLNPLNSLNNYMSVPTMQALLSLENLSVLVLDLSSGFLTSSRESGEGDHICPAIGALLHSLKTLHLRMRSICPAVLEPGDPHKSLRLGTVVVNLSLTANVLGMTSATHSKRCGPPGEGLLQLKADIQKKAEALGVRMQSPKTVRIITHTLPNFKIQSLDVLTGKTTILDDDAAWDEDGKIVEDSEPESDLLDDDFNNFLDDEYDEDD